MGWSCQCLYWGSIADTRFVAFSHRPLYASDEILIQPYFTASKAEKLHCFNIGTVMVLEPTGSSQITSDKFPNQAFLTAFIFQVALSCFRALVRERLPISFAVLG